MVEPTFIPCDVLKQRRTEKRFNSQTFCQCLLNGCNKEAGEDKVTPSVTRTVINGGPDVQIELEFRSVGFCGSRKTKEPGENPSEQSENQQQTQRT